MVETLIRLALTGVVAFVVFGAWGWLFWCVFSGGRPYLGRRR